MQYRLTLIAGAAILVLQACGEGTVEPSDNPGNEMAARFEQLADSVDGEGYSPTAEALRHAAAIVRLTGHATPVTLTVDGAQREFLAVAEQLDFPNIQCTWPGSGGGRGRTARPATPSSHPAPSPPRRAKSPSARRWGCTPCARSSPGSRMRWRRSCGSSPIWAAPRSRPGVPDVMTGLPANDAGADDPAPPPEPGDTAVTGPGYPGFIGEYLVRDVGNWWAVEGSQSNDLTGSAGTCTEDRATFDWAVFSCDAAQFRFEFTMRVDRMRYDPATGWENGPGGDPSQPDSKDIALGSSEIAGVRLKVVEWAPPPLPPVDPAPEPPPVDSTNVSPDGTTS